MGKGFSMFQFSNIVKRVLLYASACAAAVDAVDVPMVCDDNVDEVYSINHLSCSFLSLTPCATSLHFRSPNKIVCCIDKFFKKNERKERFIIFAFIVVDK